MTSSTSFPPLNKRSGNFATNEYETSIIDFNGRLLLITFKRAAQTNAYGSYVLVRDFRTGAVLAQNAWSGGLGCAIVIAGVIHIFGASNWSAVGNTILHSTLDANFAPSTPTSVLAIAGKKLYNTDIAFDGSRYVMAVEFMNSVGSGVVFYQSTDLISWSQVGAQLTPAGYTACPSIAYDAVTGLWFITALAIDGAGWHVTCVYKTADFSTFTGFTGNATYPGYICLLAPNASAGEGTNNSDVSFVEHNGMIYGVYLVGDQISWMNLRTFVYTRTLSDMIAEFWPS